MEWLRELGRRMGMLVNRQQFDRDLDEEMRLHMEMRENERRGDGLDDKDAQHAARRQFGNATRLKEVSREEWGWAWLEHLGKDLAFGVRLLRLNPAFTLAAVLSLALGVGANTAIFQLLNSLRLRVLPVQDPHELVEIKTTNDLDGASGGFTNWNPQATYAQFEALRKQQQSFTEVFASTDWSFNLASGGEVRYARGLLVSGEYFSVLGVRPHLGRLLSAADDRRGCGSPSVVVSYPYWQRAYGGAPDVIGRKLMLDSIPSEIVGVTAPGFYGVEVGRQFDIVMPLCGEDALRGDRSRLNRRDQWFLTLIGRLKPGVNQAQASTQLAALSPALYESTLPEGYNEDDRKNYLAFKLGAYAAGTGVSQLRNRFEESLWLLLGIAGLVLAIACANLANLMLARASAREREIAVRMALGASRWRLVRQLMAESFLLAAAGAVLGVFLARNLSRMMVTFVGSEGNRWFLDLRMDWRVFGFTAALALLTCFVFGLAPALRATHRGPGEALKTGARGTTAGRERFGLRRTLAVTQVALSLVLVIGAMLFSRSFNKLLAEDAGFEQAGLLVAEIDYRPLQIPTAQRVEYNQRLLERLRAVPGIRSAASTTIVPLRGSGWNNFVWLDGQPKERKALVWLSRVSDGYFATMGVPILTGRDFNAGDSIQAGNKAIVTEAFARRFMNGQNPVGQRFHSETSDVKRDRGYEIVGMVRDVKYQSIRNEVSPIVFVPATQEGDPGPYLDLMIRPSGQMSLASGGVKEVLAAVHPQIGVEFNTLQSLVRSRLLQDRLMAALSSFFGLLAAVLAAIGLYGVIAYMVERRRNEIGIRMALGATHGNVMGLILREAGALVAIGSAVGTLLALAAGKKAASMLFGMQPYDAISMSLAVTGLAFVALVASYIPARRAARLDPLTSLRQE